MVTSAALTRALSSVIEEERARLRAEQQHEVELSAIERYRFDPFAPINEGLIWIWDKELRRPVRLDPFDTQIESLEAWIDLGHLKSQGMPRFRDVVEEKSRQVGASWIYCYAAWWAVSFHPIAGLMLHLKGAKVDDGGPRNTRRSLFGKIRFMHRHLPARHVAKAPLVFRPFSSEPAKVENPERGGVIYGEGAGGDQGRGDDLDFAFGDEMAFIPWGEAVHASLGEACKHGKAYVSTPQGDDNVHARLADTKPEGTIYLRHHWSDVPAYSDNLHVAGEKPGCVRCQGTRSGVSWTASDLDAAHRYPGRPTSDWYDQAVLDKTDEQVAQELDIDRSRALPGRVYSEFDVGRHVADDPIAYDPHLPLELGGDWGLDCTAIAICQDHPSEFRIIGEVKVADMTPDQVAAVLRDTLIEVGVPAEQTTPYWTKQIHARGDATGDSREVGSGKSIFSQYRKQGFNFLAPPSNLSGPGVPVTHRINAVKRGLLGHPKPFIWSPVCTESIHDMRNNRWPVDRNTGRRRPGATAPLDDMTNHWPSGLGYLAVAKFPPPVVDPDPLEGAGGLVDDDRSMGRSARLTDFRAGMAA
jgi:hypothetical protein